MKLFIIIFVYLTTLSANDDIQTSLEFPDYANEITHLCKNEIISFNFANTTITSIGRDFISSPWITCLNFTSTQIHNIERGAFNKLPNLTQLIFSDSNIDLQKLFNFGGHENLKFLNLNDASSRIYDSYDVYIFEEYPNLEILSARKNDIRDLISEVNTPFPKLKILDLSSNQIQSTDFVKLLPNSLHVLDLHDNSLSSLVFDKNHVNLLALNLDYNNLRYITNVMTGLENLQYLSVSGNKIDSIESNAFEDTNKLVYLNLSTNKITHFHSEIFIKLQSLRLLDLNYNMLEEIPQISNETIISTLFLNCNNIKSIISNAFVQMPKLMKLLLGGNQIIEINVKAFAHLSLLEILDLSRNKLSFLPEGWSEFLISLKYLNLNDNQFISLESLSLTNVLPLMELHLANISLEYLNISYFENLPQNLIISLKEFNSANWNSARCRPTVPTVPQTDPWGTDSLGTDSLRTDSLRTDSWRRYDFNTG
ncbi:leucine-rich repeat-containing G-protein coupled receptor 5-like [Camponotus floridanus]|uniref:leucine-rich repeat-containing G-protein coupled receptor 5-like n=1 Tax=Camponotus floridanus TaxID=104421 RepID=UPI000DC6A995|nr:leucine-rich repeat-containing G-protein coupled receptor 5-like [Camponotus floridanus]